MKIMPPQKSAAKKQLADYRAGEEVEGFFALRDCSINTTQRGDLFLKMTLGDASGASDGTLWNVEEKFGHTFAAGMVVKIVGGVETYRGKLQIRVEKIRGANANEVTPQDFLPQSKFPRSEMEAELDAGIAAVNDDDYQQLLQNFFTDASLREKFCTAPAAKVNHHAWVSGLLEHTVGVLRYGQAMLAQTHQKLNADLLLTGIILHDVGKVDELALGAAIEYTDAGKLLGHIVIGAQMVAERAGAGMPKLKQQLVQHLLLSHHGTYEFGSPVLPVLPEAFALNLLDNLDAKTVAAVNWIAADKTPGDWTQRSYMLEKSLYKIPPALFVPPRDADNVTAPLSPIAAPETVVAPPENLF
jgi:3'-5' exoribonuclease